MLVRKGVAGASFKILLQLSGLVFRLNGNVGYEFPRAEADG
jgi:hypothetical protein